MAPESERANVKKFRKKPVVIEAVQWFKNGDHGAVSTPPHDCLASSDVRCMRCAEASGKHGEIATLESGKAEQLVCPGDWIITGVKGEHYPCKPDIFAATYDAAENSEQMHETSQRMTNPNEPTLTCSEVVERLLEECHHVGMPVTCHFSRSLALAILHSWRERRVQELEKCLREIVNERYTELDMMRCPFPPDSAVSNAWHDGVRAAWRQSDLVKQIAKDALAKSDEWREQIRKGANHESA